MISVRRDILIYALAFAFAGGTPFILLPILTRYLTLLQFGEVTSFLVWSTLFANLAGISAHGFISVRYFRVKVEQFRILVMSSFATITIAHIVVLILVTILYPFFNDIFKLSFNYVVIAIISALFLNINLQILAIFQVSGKPLMYLYSRIMQATIELTLCITLLYSGLINPGARVYSYTLALIASVSIGVVYCKRLGYFNFRVEKQAIHALLQFGVPILPHIIAGTAITYLDRLLVSSILGTESLGIYMVAMQIGMAMIIFIEPLNRALTPWLFQQLNRDQFEVRRMIVLRTYQLFIALVLIGIVLSYTSYYLFEIFIDRQFLTSRQLIPWMVAGFVMQGMYYTQVNYLFYAERTGRLSIITASVATFGCLISWGMTTVFGLVGAAASFFINNTLLFLLVWLAASQYVPMPWRLVK